MLQPNPTQGGAPNINAGLSNSSAGYNNALGSLNQSMKLLQGSDSSQLMQAQQGLAQNQGRVQQGLINSGLGNTSVAQTMQQAPLQTYNNQVAGIQNNLAQQQAGVLEHGAGIQAGQAQQAQQYQQFLMQMMQQQQAQTDKTKASQPTGPNYAAALG